MPHSPGSRFILFAHEALKPFYDPSEVGPVPLARRWERMKKVHLKTSFTSSGDDARPTPSDDRIEDPDQS